MIQPVLRPIFTLSSALVGGEGGTRILLDARNGEATIQPWPMDAVGARLPWIRFDENLSRSEAALLLAEHGSRIIHALAQKSPQPFLDALSKDMEAYLAAHRADVESPSPEWLGVSQAARAVKYSPAELWRWVGRGELAVVTIHGSKMVNAPSVEALADAKRRSSHERGFGCVRRNKS